MRRTSTMLACTAAMTLWTCRLFAADGVLIAEKTVMSGTTRTSQVQIEPNRMRTEMVNPNGDTQVMIFDGTKQVMWMINPAKKTYTEMTKADADRMGAQVSEAMGRMQEQMRSMTPEQRAMMEQMMRGRGAPGMPGVGAAPKTEYRKTGTDRVGKWTCDKYEGYQNNQKVSELCTVDPKALGFGLSDFGVAQQFAEFFKAMIPQGADRVFAVGRPEIQGFSGIPVRRVAYIGQVQTVTEVTDASRQNFPGSTFEVPAGFQKEPLAGMGAMGRGGARGTGR